MVESPPCSAGKEGLVPGCGTKILHAVEHAKSIITSALFSQDFLGWGKPAIMLGGPSSCSVEKPCGEELPATHKWPAV